MIKVLIKKLSHKAQIPIYKTEGSSGMDLMALTEDKIVIKPKASILNLIFILARIVNKI